MTQWIPERQNWYPRVLVQHTMRKTGDDNGKSTRIIHQHFKFQLAA
jgi:hypothetical protein